ncbi:E3 ubiquitin-protein ligase [Plasmodium gonderi]|uniref:E3 ubiquitin-protein ligase n=1 Tax=Plasmodium gonderi TaxID=77519 RepID=A0A1Y1JKU1_PLAGO|nr:E3 ubiquitin-protein ligase [Plasmodium gonderi]GAW80654.1 E3 ubiquitin-protein ligase [Plasmodium gonderi]
MNIIDEYDLDMYKNTVMSNNCKDEDIWCIFNMSSFMNTLCFLIFFIIFLWGLSIISRYYTSYNIMKYLRDRKAIYMQNMSRYINEIKMLCRSHVNDIIRIKKKITPKNVEKINLNITINDNIQLFKSYLSSSANDMNNYFKYTITFTFSTNNCVYVTLYWGVLLNEINHVIHEKIEAGKKCTNGKNTVICIDNFKNFFKEGFSKTLQSKPSSSDAMAYLLDNEKNNIYNTTEEEEHGVGGGGGEGRSGHTIRGDENYDPHHKYRPGLSHDHNKDYQNFQNYHNHSSLSAPIYNNTFINFNSCFYKTSSSFFSTGENITYTMPHDENFCVTDILNQIEIEKNTYLDEVKEKLKKDKLDENNPLDEKILNNYMTEEQIRIPLVIVINSVPSPPGSPSMLNSTPFVGIGKTVKDNGKKAKYCNNENISEVVLVDFKKMKDKYKPFIIKDICVMSENGSTTTAMLHKSKKKNQSFQFVDILDIYGHEEHDKECLICMTSYKDTLLMPCRHSSFCYDCMKSLRQEKCPICRCLFNSFIKFPLRNMDRASEMP